MHLEEMIGTDKIRVEESGEIVGTIPDPQWRETIISYCNRTTDINPDEYHSYHLVLAHHEIDSPENLSDALQEADNIRTEVTDSIKALVTELRDSIALIDNEKLQDVINIIISKLETIPNAEHFKGTETGY